MTRVIICPLTRVSPLTEASDDWVNQVQLALNVL